MEKEIVVVEEVDVFVGIVFFNTFCWFLSFFEDCEFRAIFSKNGSDLC